MTLRTLPPLLAVLTLPGCFLALDFDRDDDRGQWSADDDRDDTASDDDDTLDTDDSDAADTDDATLGVTIVADPDELPVGDATIVVLTITHDHIARLADRVASVVLSEDVTVGATRVLDDDTIALTVDVPADSDVGPVDLTLDLDGIGVVVFTGALTRVTP